MKIIPMKDFVITMIVTSILMALIAVISLHCTL